MPSPVGHALAGFTIGLLADRTASAWPPGQPRKLLTTMTVLSATVAALPDVDLLSDFHRGWTHSLGATALVAILTAAVTGKVTDVWVRRVRQVRGVRGVRQVRGVPRGPAWRLAFALAAAQASHILLDWLGTDRFPPSGIQVFWPFGTSHYLSGWDIFPRTERNFANPDILAINLRAVLFELFALGPLVWLSIMVKRRRRSRVLISVPDHPQPPSA